MDDPRSTTCACLKERSYAAVIVDEAQFLSASQIDRLSDIVDDFDIPVLCYGLRTDFTSHLFEGSKRLMEIADVIEEVPTVCWCGRRAHYNTRIKDGKVVRTGEQIMLGGNETYVSLCRKHFKEGRIEK
jgi:thymidine kinase